jgi:hypothetical protein
MESLAADKAPVRKKQRGRPRRGSLANGLRLAVCELRSAGNLCGLGVHAPAVESVVNYFTDRGNVRINIHPITGREMTNNSLGGDFQNGTGQLGKTPRLNVVDSLKPLSQRQALIKIHVRYFSF